MVAIGRKIYIIFILLWLFGNYCIFQAFHSISNNKNKVFEEQIELLENEVKSLEKIFSQLKLEKENIQCHQWKTELKDMKYQLDVQIKNTTMQNKPTLEYEQLRRKLEKQAREIFYFTTDQMNEISDKLADDDKQLWGNVILRYSDQNRVLLASIRNLTSVDGYQPWRQAEHENLSKLMQARLTALQNPARPCDSVKRVLYYLNEYCGYGCQIHRAMRCFLLAYARGETMILDSGGWSYNFGGFEEIFQPISQVCNTSSAIGASTWRELVPVLSNENNDPRKDFMPMAIPEDLSQRLIHIHEHPFVWFIGQLMKYFIKPQPWLREFIKKRYDAIQFQTPIVGIHVRRTDKQTEAAFHDVSEYMKYVEDFYIIYQYQNPNVNLTKRIYVATDEPKVFQEIRTQYPDYVVYGDEVLAKSAQLKSRYGTESLKVLLLDIHFLSLSDYLVCTFSSQVCRAAYEIMQQRVTDGAWRVQSLDDVYFFESQNAHHQRATLSHKTIRLREFIFERGDVIHTEGNHWDGFSKGSDLTNGKSGLYPSYKTEEIIKIGQMYTYPGVQVKTN